VKSLKKILILNWKEFGELEDIENLFQGMTYMKTFRQLSWIFCPPVILISDSIKLLDSYKTNNIFIGSQSIDFCNGTGRIRGKALSRIGCKYAMCGHAEKPNFRLKDEILECSQNFIKPIALIETLVDLTLLQGAIVVYEPRAAVGADKAANISEIAQLVAQARQKYASPVLYGGAVTAKNAGEIARVTDGLCIGRASRDLEQINLIVEAIMD
jgi:triosephosphate isomerase